MTFSISAAVNSHSSYIRLGTLELHVERHREHSPEGWLAVTRPVHGEVVLSVGRWAFHAVNHRRVSAGYQSGAQGV